jgi:hypothetical protein
MERNEQHDKLEAIYDLREAAEQKGRAEHALEVHPSSQARDALLDAQLDVEKKTVTAIDACHECGLEHAPGQSHGNVVKVDFKRRSQTERD